METIAQVLSNRFGVVPDTIVKIMYSGMGIIFIGAALLITAWLAKFVQAEPGFDE